MTAEWALPEIWLWERCFHLFLMKNAFIKEINSIGIPGTVVSYENDSKCGISGIHISVQIEGKEECDETYLHHSHEHVHHHAGLDDIRKIIDNLKVSDKVKKEVTDIYMMIAQAESKVHKKRRWRNSFP